MSEENLNEIYARFEEIWAEFCKELSKNSLYKEFADSVPSQEKLSDFVESLPKTSHSWKLIESYAFYKDKLIEDAISWFLFGIEPLFKQLNSLDSTPIKFTCTDDIYFASVLQKDNLLPNKLSAALAETFISTMSEVQNKKYSVDTLFMKPPKSGRKKGSGVSQWSVMHRYYQQIKLNPKKTQAYSTIAKDMNVSKDTIRRIVERYSKLKESRSDLKIWLKEKCLKLEYVTSDVKIDLIKNCIIDELLEIYKSKENSKYYLGLTWFLCRSSKRNEKQPLKKDELLNGFNRLIEISIEYW